MNHYFIKLKCTYYNINDSIVGKSLKNWFIYEPITYLYLCNLDIQYLYTYSLKKTIILT